MRIKAKLFKKQPLTDGSANLWFGTVDGERPTTRAVQFHAHATAEEAANFSEQGTYEITVGTPKAAEA